MQKMEADLASCQGLVIRYFLSAIRCFSDRPLAALVTPKLVSFMGQQHDKSNGYFLESSYTLR
jgi:hypothetical protein